MIQNGRQTSLRMAMDHMHDASDLADDVLISALYVEAEEAHNASQPAYNVESGLQRLRAGLDERMGDIGLAQLDATPEKADHEEPHERQAHMAAVPARTAVRSSSAVSSSVGAAARHGAGVTTVRRRRLGSELRRMREAHSIKLQEAADQLGVTASALSRIETGKAPARSAYLTAMLEMYDVDDPARRQVLIDMAREGHRKGWWAAYEDVLPTGFGIYMGLEAEASSLRAFEPVVVHGLLQTEDYARAVMTTVRRELAAEGIERLVTLRMQRQEALTRADPLELWLILDESALRRSIGGPELMHNQLAHLAQVSLWPNVTLQVLPFASGPHPFLNGPFCIIEFPGGYDPDVVYTEGVAGQGYLERDKDVRACAEGFDLLRTAALSPAESTAMIGKMAIEIAGSIESTPNDTRLPPYAARPVVPTSAETMP